MTEHMSSPLAEQVAAGYDFAGPALELGALMLDADRLVDVPVRIPLAMLNRHGLVAGATGTGKTRTLQVLVEQLSAQGVPVFAADIKGDLSGIAQPGAASEKLTARAAAVGQECGGGAGATRPRRPGGAERPGLRVIQLGGVEILHDAYAAAGDQDATVREQGGGVEGASGLQAGRACSERRRRNGGSGRCLRHDHDRLVRTPRARHQASDRECREQPDEQQEPGHRRRQPEAQPAGEASIMGVGQGEPVGELRRPDLRRGVLEVGAEGGGEVELGGIALSHRGAPS